MDMSTLRLLKKLEGAQPNQFKVYNTSTSFKQSNYYYNSNNKIVDLENSNSNCFILLASNVRTECAVLNIKLRIKAKNKIVDSLSFGQRMEPTFAVKFINITPSLILNVLEAKVKGFSQSVFTKCQPVFLIGESFFQRINLDKNSFISHLNKYVSNNIVLVLNKKSNSESIDYLNVKSLNSRRLESKGGYMYCCNLEDSVKVRSLVESSSLTSIWVHTHGSQAASLCDHILPTLSHLESEGVFINLEQRPQKSTKMVENRSPATVYSLFEIVEIVKENLNIRLADNSKTPQYVNFHHIDEMVKNGNLFSNLSTKLITLASKQEGIVGLHSDYPFKPVITDYYRTNSYSPYSLNMTNYSTKKRFNNNVLLNLIA